MLNIKTCSAKTGANFKDLLHDFSCIYRRKLHVKRGFCQTSLGSFDTTAGRTDKPIF